MGLGAVLLGGLALLGGAALAKAIFDDLSSSEKARQREAWNDYDDYRAQVNRRISGMQAERDRQIGLAQENHQTMLAQLRIQMRQEFQELNRAYYDKMTAAIQARIKEKTELAAEIRKALDILKEQRRQQQSLLRQSSLDLYDRQLELALKKTQAYLVYLRQYEKNFAKTYQIANPEKPLPEPFDFLLPKDFPYQGQILHRKRSEIGEGFSVQVQGLHFPLEFDVSDSEQTEMFHTDAMIPLLVERYDSENHCYKVSCAKGLFMYNALYQPGVGLEAVVASLSVNEVTLDYHGLVLKLPKRNLENAWKMPFVGSTIHVYPSKWNHSLTFVQVTQKYEESVSIMQIKEIPLMIQTEDYPAFRDFLKKRQLDQSQDEWKIAPWDDADEPFLKTIRLQLGSSIVIKGEIVKSEETGAVYILYREIYDQEHLITPEQVFLAIDASLRVCRADDVRLIPEQDFQNMNHLYMLIMEEFRKQRDILESTKGMLYYNRWLEAMEKLCYRKEKGRPVTCQKGLFRYMYRERETGRHKWEAEVHNPEDIHQFLERLGEVRNATFFIELTDGTRVPAAFSPQTHRIYAYGEHAQIQQIEETTYVSVYPKTFSYADLKQREALQQFRMGKLTNPRMKLYMLGPEKIEERSRETKLEHYFNPQIEANANQRETVRRAFEAEDFYMIQGPPGTGKTTVIQELVLQELHHYPDHRILIVSQANVAVDNVLRGLLRKQSSLIRPGEIVRCGSEEKIAPELAALSFERMYADHREQLNNRIPAEGNQKYFDLWKEWMAGDHAQKAEFGELILKGCRIVAATCVGLAQRKIGLDKLEFDLVIIDEAGKALPGEMLIPLLRAKKAIVIGDHHQLPPTVDPLLLDGKEIELEDHEYAVKEMFEKSLFEHLFTNCPDTNKMMLNTQYRMPDCLGSLVSRLFYGGGVQNGEVTYEKEPIGFDRHLNWVDMSGDRDYYEIEDDSGITNLRETEVVLDLIVQITRQTAQQVRIAVITPYKGQKRRLVRTLKALHPELLGQRVVVDTIDSFQGDEAEVVLYCTTRARKKTDYFSQKNRLNVAISRAKHTIVFIGSGKYFLSYGEEAPVSQIYRFVQEHGSVSDPA